MKIVLAYSGGLDTTAVVARYTDEGHEVVAAYGELGQPGELEQASARAMAAGAAALEVLDLREGFARDYLGPALKANATYEGRYPLVSALSRPCISAALVDVARRHGADAVAHGCTGKGNDQVRFEVSIRALAPDLDVLAPIRDWQLSRDDSMRLLESKGIAIDVTKRSPYSIDENVWGRACEAGVIEDPWAAPPEEAFGWTNPLAAAPTTPREVVVGFTGGLPTALDGEATDLLGALEALNSIGSEYGTGRLDVIENRLVGIKSREVYEAPGALALLEAHRSLEDLCMERDLLHEKARVEIRWAELVYNGQWFSPLREALDAFVESSQAGLDGEVRLRYEAGRVTTVGRRSPAALYDESLATYGDGDTFDQSDSTGFVKLFGLPVVHAASVREARR
ncbi:MAG: argininosuccinate synthase [Acidimicrobiia bacterium]|nr:argininosuccinate synthase [Acidimicrobiia bacterium]